MGVFSPRHNQEGFSRTLEVSIENIPLSVGQSVCWLVSELSE